MPNRRDGAPPYETVGPLRWNRYCLRSATTYLIVALVTPVYDTLANGTFTQPVAGTAL